MKKKHYIYYLSILLSGTLVLLSCRNDLEYLSQEKESELIAEAKALFEKEFGIIAQSQRELPTGETTLLWSRAVVSSNERIECVDIPVTSQYTYRPNTHTGGEEYDERLFADITNKFVFVKEKDTGRSAVYRATYVPDRAQTRSSSIDEIDRLTNCGDKGTFSGHVLYSVIDGYLPLRVNTYENGVKTQGISLFNDCSCHLEYVISARMAYELVSEIMAARQPALFTRGHCSEPGSGWSWNSSWGSNSGAGGDCVPEKTDDWEFDRQYTDLGGGFFYCTITGQVLYDYDGDGHPDSVWLPTVDVPGSEPTPPGYNDPDPDPLPDPYNPPGAGGVPKVIAPKAKKIFRNSKLDEKAWKELEKMIEKIIADCLGGALYDGMVTILNGKTLIIQFDGSNKGIGSFVDGTITIGNNESNVLLHELFHAYQYYNETPESLKGSYLNREVEAWYAQYVYVSKLPEYQVEGNKWRDMYKKSAVGKCLERMSFDLTSKGSLKSSANETMFGNSVVAVAESLKKIPAYSNHPFDHNKWGLDNLSNFIKLSINC